MDSNTDYFSVVEVIGDYGIVQVKESIFFNNGKLFKRRIVYDVCLNYGEGDIIASFNTLKLARKYAKEN